MHREQIHTPKLAYLTSAYARAGDTFIRGEVTELRRQGFCVHTFSIRRDPNQQISDEIRIEQEGTTYILEQGVANLLFAVAMQLVTAPLAFVSTLGLAMRVRSYGIRSLIWHCCYLAEAAYLARRMKKLGVQHLHNHIAENSATVAMLASSMTGIPFSFTVHGPHEFYVVSQIALGEKIARAKFVSCISSFCKSQCMGWSDPKHWYKLKEIHCGLDDRFLKEEPSPILDQPRLLCVGRLCADKGQTLLIEAIAKLRAQGVELHLELIGDGPTRGEVEAAITRYGLEKSVTLSGWKSSEEIACALRSALVFVLPSFAEGLPVVIMEALAMGRPVIATYVAGNPELVHPGENGWLVPAGDVEALAAAIREALNTPIARLMEMGACGRKAVLDRHDIRKEATKLRNLFLGNETHESIRM